MSKKYAIIVLFVMSVIALSLWAANITRNARLAAQTGNQVLTTTINAYYYADKDLIAGVQMNDNIGNPLEAELDVRLLYYDRSSVKAQGNFSTDNQGSGFIRLPLENLGSGDYFLQITASSEAGRDVFEQQVHVLNTEPPNFTIHFDKGLYNPGDDVLFRILVTNRSTDRPVQQEYRVSIFDGNDNRVFNETVSTSEFGIISGIFSLASEVNSGMYRLVIENEDSMAEQSFEVRPYYLPKFEVTVDTDKSDYIIGDTVLITVNAQYFFGEPVNQGNVSIFVDNNLEVDSAPLDSYGSHTFSFVVDEAKSYNVQVEVVDNSNYMVIQNRTIRVGTDIFEIELLPEHRQLVRGISNDVYLFTRTLDGTPVRTHVQLSSPSFHRQVATDENGIAKFTLDNIPVGTSYTVNVQAVDMDGNSVTRQFDLESTVRDVVISTDKPRYSQGETIRVSLASMLDSGTFLIYAYKNNRLLDIASTQGEDVEFDLGETYGIIDLFAVRPMQTGENSTTSDSRVHARRTIFIDPGKSMYITLSTDRPEYEPGENVALSVGVTDNYGNKLDAALLISIVDEAVLNVAANDLTIDNIKLALSDIQFSDELDAATLYTSLISNASEQAIMGLLLRQEHTDPTYTVARASTIQDEQIAGVSSAQLFWLFLVLIVACLLVKFHAFRRFMIRFAVYAFIVFIFIIAPLTMLIALVEWLAILLVPFLVVTLFPLCIFVIYKISIMFAKRDQSNNNDYDNDQLPISNDASQETFNSGKNGIGRAILIMIGMVIVSVILAIVLTSCGGAPNMEAPSADSALHSEQDVVADMWEDAAPRAEAPQLNMNESAMEPETDSGGFVDSVPDVVVRQTPAPERDEAQADSAPERDDMLTENAEWNDTQNLADDREEQITRVRSLFLETLRFDTEVIVNNGEKVVDIGLADNITTWNIQVVGNTMDGIVGHGESQIRAFQPFFIDFELPRNSIRHDEVSIPVTVFNYTDSDQEVEVTIRDMSWFTLNTDAVHTINVPSNQSQLIYVPITIEEFGTFDFRADAVGDGFSDAAQRSIRVNPEGHRVERVISSGTIDGDLSQHILFMQDDIPDTRRAHVRFHPSAMSQVVEGLENIFRMPTGCFEQISSTLYPNILALRYMSDSDTIDEHLYQRAMGYIVSGYQRLLTYEVRSEPGGFSMYGRAPAETVLTAYGLMQLTDLSSVYDVEEELLDRMKEFLFRHQNDDGSFEITGWQRAGGSRGDRLVLDAYITWALSESFPEDPRLEISVDYLRDMLNTIDDNYTLALIANIFINVNDDDLAMTVIDRLMSSVEVVPEGAYIGSTTRDYFGAFGFTQQLQATALTSVALSRLDAQSSTNGLLIDYIIAHKDPHGTWHSTQATILCLKAIMQFSITDELGDGQVTITIGDTTRTIDVRQDNTLDLYQVSFDDLEQENIIEISFPLQGSMVYEIIQEFYIPFENLDIEESFLIIADMETELSVNQLVSKGILIINATEHIVDNALVVVSIPQGFRVEQSSLVALEHSGVIEKFETRFESINLYLRNTHPGEIIELEIEYRPAYPANITGGHIRVYDYYNPSIEGIMRPFNIVVE